MVTNRSDDWADATNRARYYVARPDSSRLYLNVAPKSKWAGPYAFAKAEQDPYVFERLRLQGREMPKEWELQALIDSYPAKSFFDRDMNYTGEVNYGLGIEVPGYSDKMALERQQQRELLKREELRQRPQRARSVGKRRPRSF